MVHASGLFGRHIGERAGDELGRCRRLPFARQTRGKAETGQADLSVRAVDQEMGGLQILVHQATRVEFAKRLGEDTKFRDAWITYESDYETYKEYLTRTFVCQGSGDWNLFKLFIERDPLAAAQIPQAIFSEVSL